MPSRDPEVARQKSAERMRKMRARRIPFSGMSPQDIAGLIWDYRGAQAAPILCGQLGYLLRSHRLSQEEAARSQVEPGSDFEWLAEMPTAQIVQLMMDQCGAVVAAA